MKPISRITRPARTVQASVPLLQPRFASATRLLYAVASAVALAACSSTVPVAVPAAIAVPAGQSLAAVANARGVQIYECRKDKDADTWVFVAPEARLFNVDGSDMGSHGAAARGGPAWQASDGSRIVGAVKGRADAPQGDAIAWLLLSTTSDGPEGRFSTVKSVQRVNTAGGVAPKEGCSPASYGQRLRVPYTATYQFFVEQRAAAAIGY